METVNWTDMVVKNMLRYEILEENVREPLNVLKKLFTFDFLSQDKKTAYYTLHYRQQEKNVHESFKIRLHCIKGSFLTFLWNRNARFDEEYIVEVEERRIVKQIRVEKNVMEIDEHLPSIVEEEEEIPPLPSFDTLLTKEKVLWYMKGLDVYNKKISQGYCNWHLMRNIQINVRIFEIGLLAFAKLLGRLLLLLPISSLTNTYMIPMPITFMYNYLLMVETCPLIMKVTSKTKAIVEALKGSLLNKLGSAPWIYSYFPFWNSSGRKFLCSIFNVEKEFLPIGGFSIFQETKTRLIEIIECKLGKNGLIGIVECVYPRQWEKIVRYVVLDLFAVCDAIQLFSKENMHNFKDASLLKTTPKIELIGEVEWIRMNFMPNDTANRKKKDTTATVGEEKGENSNLNLIDFRNTTTWGSYKFSLNY